MAVSGGTPVSLGILEVVNDREDPPHFVRINTYTTTRIQDYPQKKSVATGGRRTVVTPFQASGGLSLSQSS